MEKTVYWQGHSWLKRHHWGKVHPQDPVQWSDPECVFKDSKDRIHLLTKNREKYFQHIDRKVGTGRGLIWNETPMGKGYYEIVCKLPRGYNLWPAFWLYPDNSWPPEIDVFEAYTKNRGSYFQLSFPNLFSIWEVETNVHYNDKYQQSKNVGAKKHCLGFEDPSQRFITYGCHIKDEKIDIYYDEKKVRTIKDEHILDQVSKYNGHFHVVINNGVDNDVNPNTHSISDFEIKKFNYLKE